MILATQQTDGFPESGREVGMFLESSHLSTLIAVADHGSFSKAADVLGITQSAVSQNIKKLESIIGVPLIAKTAKASLLTSEGEKLVNVARSYGHKMSEVLEDITKGQEENDRGEISLGTLMGLGKSWLAPLVIDFLMLYPKIKIKVELGGPDELIELFEKQKIDILILPGPQVPAYVDATLLQQEKITLVIPQDEKFKIDSQTSLKDLLEYPLIFFQDRDPLFYQWCKAQFGVTPRFTNPRMTINSFGHILRAIGSGMGIAVLPTHVYDHYVLFKDKVRTLGAKYEVDNHGIYFITQQGQHAKRIQLLQNFLMKNQI
ncbi:MAG: LysR family transcriptional regulator [Bacteriovoracaceae bacterium]|nr:LysR family transcriptional regulator [Bacteriovoracaceae bacterium]